MIEFHPSIHRQISVDRVARVADEVRRARGVRRNGPRPSRIVAAVRRRRAERVPAMPH